MLDRLLGRAELKERIADLEAERDSLRAQLDAESERRADAVADRQAAEERVNRLEDRVVELEDRVERLRGEEPTLEYRRVESVRGDRLADLLGRLRGVETGPEGALTAAVAAEADALPAAVEAAFGERAALVRRAAPAVAVADDAGLVSAALVPPLPPEPFAAWDDSFRLADEWFRPTGRFAFALVRADTFAGGVYEGDERVAFEGFESDVGETHSKGGFSQARFERRRDEQVAEHLDRVRATVEGFDAERTLLVGERTVLSELRDLADATGTVDAGGADPGALDDAFRSFWTTDVYAV